MAEKKDAYELISNAFLNSQLNDDELEKNFPKINAWFNSASTKEDRQKRLSSVLGDPDFQNELRKFDDFVDFDFSEFKPPEKNAYKPGELKNADMKDVQKFYAKAKSVIDPTGKLGKTELYDTAGDATFQQLEEKIGENYTGDWFGELLNAFNYPDTPEGMEQLTQDFQTALTRMKNHDFADKYGKAKAPLKFLFKNTFDALEDGQKPGISDTMIDAGTNLAWFVPASKMIPGAASIVSSIPKFVKGSEIVLKGARPKTILGKIGKGLATAAAVPASSEALDYAFGTDTSQESKNGLMGRAERAGMGALVNLATPGLLKMVPLRGGSIVANFNINPKNAATVNRKIADFIDFGSRQNAAKQKLNIIAEYLAEKKDVALEFAKRLSKYKNVSMDKATSVAADFKGILEDNAEDLARAIVNNGGNLGKGIASFMNSGRDKFKENLLQKIAETNASPVEEFLPWLSSYIVNKAGRDGVKDWIQRMYGRVANRFSDNEE